MGNYLSKSIISNVGSTFKRHTTKTVPLNVGIAFNKKSHKLETVIKIPVVQKLTEVPNQTWVAYTLLNKNHAEKRAEIFRCQQETGTIYRAIMQTLNRGGNVSGDEVNKFAIGIDFLVQNKKNVTSHMINTLAKGIDTLHTYNPGAVSRGMVNVLAKGIDTLHTNNPQSVSRDMVEVLTKEIKSLQTNNLEPVSLDMVNGLAKGIDTLHTYNPRFVSRDMVNVLAKGIDTLHTYNPRFVSRDMVNGLAKGIDTLHTNNPQSVSRDMVNTLTKGIDTLHTYNPGAVSRDMVEVLTKEIKSLQTNNLEPVSRDMVNGLAKGIDTLHTYNPGAVSRGMVNVLAKGIDTLHTYNPGSVSHDMVNGLAKGIDTLHTYNPGAVSLDMVEVLTKEIKSLQTNNPEPVSLDMVNGLAKGIKSLLSQNIKKDLSYELKTLSLALLTSISNYDINVLIELKNTFDDLEKSVKKTSAFQNPSFKLREGDRSYLLALESQQVTYTKKDGEFYKYNRRASEIFNFQKGYECLSELTRTFTTAQKHEIQLTNKKKKRDDITAKINVALIKLKSPKKFQNNVSFDTIIKEYANKTQEEVGVKNSDIRIVGGDIVFFTHQYDTADKTKYEYLRPNSGAEVCIQKNSAVKIKNNPQNIEKLNRLIKLLKDHCHDDSYAFLTHLVHRAIERFGETENGYDLDETIKSISKLLSLKDEILNNNYKMLNEQEINNLKLLNTLRKDINGFSRQNAKINDIINNLQTLRQKTQDKDITDNINKLIKQLNNAPCATFSQYCKKKKLTIKQISNTNNLTDREVTKNKGKLQSYIIKIISEKENNTQEKIENFCTKNNIAYNDFDIKEFIGEVQNAFTNYTSGETYDNFIKEMQNTFKEIFDGYIQKKQFTLSYSDQGNKYNYNAYELTTELGTLILDNEGKVTTIMGRTIFDS